MTIAMNAGVNSNVVHEAEAQRQHARLQLPAKIKFPGPNRKALECELLDLSVGGFSFTSTAPLLAVGGHHQGKLIFQIDGLTLAIDVEFQVRSVSAEGLRVGCEFHNLRPREISALRYLITSYLSGELVTLGDMLNTLQRDNFTASRKGKDAGAGMGFFARARALGLSLVLFAVGLSAFGYVLSQLYGLYFVTRAESAMVSLPAQQVSMPREGTVQGLVKVGGEVAKGAPLATFSSTMLDVLKGSLPEAQLTPERIERLFNKTLQGTLTSPCDCRVVAQLVADGQTAAKGAVVFELVPLQGQASIEARFPYKSFAKLQPGAVVRFQVAGENFSRSGKIAAVATQVLAEGRLSSDIRVVIQPDSALAVGLAGRPVEVSIDGLLGAALIDDVAATHQ